MEGEYDNVSEEYSSRFRDEFLVFLKRAEESVVTEKTKFLPTQLESEQHIFKIIKDLNNMSTKYYDFLKQNLYKDTRETMNQNGEMIKEFENKIFVLHQNRFIGFVADDNFDMNWFIDSKDQFEMLQKEVIDRQEFEIKRKERLKAYTEKFSFFTDTILNLCPCATVQKLNNTIKMYLNDNEEEEEKEECIVKIYNEIFNHCYEFHINTKNKKNRWTCGDLIISAVQLIEEISLMMWQRSNEFYLMEPPGNNRRQIQIIDVENRRELIFCPGFIDFDKLEILIKERMRDYGSLRYNRDSLKRSSNRWLYQMNGGSDVLITLVGCFYTEQMQSNSKVNFDRVNIHPDKNVSSPSIDYLINILKNLSTIMLNIGVYCNKLIFQIYSELSDTTEYVDCTNGLSDIMKLLLLFKTMFSNLQTRVDYDKGFPKNFKSRTANFLLICEKSLISITHAFGENPNSELVQDGVKMLKEIDLKYDNNTNKFMSLTKRASLVPHADTVISRKQFKATALIDYFRIAVTKSNTGNFYINVQMYYFDFLPLPPSDVKGTKRRKIINEDFEHTQLEENSSKLLAIQYHENSKRQKLDDAATASQQREEKEEGV